MGEPTTSDFKRALYAHVVRHDRAYARNEDGSRALAEMAIAHRELLIGLDREIRGARTNGAAGHPHLEAILGRFERLFSEQVRMGDAWKELWG